MNRYPNLIVLRTLSKAWAIAGARCGVAIASAQLVELLQKVRAPYPIPVPATQAILEGIDQTREKLLKERVSSLILERERFITELKSFSSVLLIYPSETNFLLVQFQDPAKVFNGMKKQGIILRDRSSESGLSGCIRITLGTRDENQKVLSVLKEVLA